MEAKLVIGLVVIIVVVAHIWLYLWVRFKIDEGVLLKCLRENAAVTSATKSNLAAHASLGQRRVASVCVRSKLIEQRGQIYLAL